MPTEVSIRELYELTKEGTDLEKDQYEFVQLQGWIRTNRASKNVGFISLNDGTCFQNAQIVYSSDTLADYDKAGKYLTGTAIAVIGRYVETPEAKQPFEIQATEI
ncbi:MAG: asparagine--tRNA ligase, partial [Erysipelotrichaceae bacterium]|nr:asparagine--tRNA ligase [Erysipelotrichaceae bacterium]